VLLPPNALVAADRKRQSHAVIVLMIQLMPNATDIQTRFPVLVFNR
jgi:hypothetical protein